MSFEMPNALQRMSWCLMTPSRRESPIASRRESIYLAVVLVEYDGLGSTRL